MWGNKYMKVTISFTILHWGTVVHYPVYTTQDPISQACNLQSCHKLLTNGKQIYRFLT